MFGLGIWEVVVILLVALIVLGPQKLPELARQLGKLTREFRRAANELRYGLDRADRPTQPRPPPPPEKKSSDGQKLAQGQESSEEQPASMPDVSEQAPIEVEKDTDKTDRPKSDHG